METVLVVSKEPQLYKELLEKLKGQCKFLYGSSYESGIMQLSYNVVDVLVMDMELPGGDGLSFLQEAEDNVPEACLVLSYLATPFICQKAKDLGATAFFLKPCSSKAVLSRLQEALQKQKKEPPERSDLQNRAAFYLARLQIPTKLEGYNQLRVGIPLYLQDSGLLLNKELYPAVAEITGAENGSLVERSIRSAIHTGYQQAPAVWNELFPDSGRAADDCPSNKEVISKIAQCIQLEELKYIR